MPSLFCVVMPCSPLRVTNIKGKGNTNVKKRKLFQCLIKHHVIKVRGGMEA